MNRVPLSVFYIPLCHMPIMARVIFGRLSHVVYDLLGNWGRQWHWGTYNYTATGLRTAGPGMLWFEQVSPLLCITFLMFLHFKCRVGRGISVSDHLPIVSHTADYHHLSPQMPSQMFVIIISNVCLFLWSSFHVFFYFSSLLVFFQHLFYASGISCQETMGSTYLCSYHYE